LDLGAAAWLLESCTNTPVVDDDDRRRPLDAASGGEIGVQLVLESAKIEGLMVASSLEHLGEEALRPPRSAGGRRVEEEELWAMRALCDRSPRVSC
jgi:hypothetical protein